MAVLFPVVESIALQNAASGSLVLINRGDDRWLAFTTDETTQKGRGIVVLRGSVQQRQTPVFLPSYQGDSECLLLGSEFQLRLGFEEEDIHQGGGAFLEAPGTILVKDKRLLMRAAPFDGFREDFVLVDMNSGEVLRQSTMRGWTFTRWQLLLPCGVSEETTEVFSFVYSRSV